MARQIIPRQITQIPRPAPQIQLNPIQLQKPQVPVDQIIQVLGQNPVASGIKTGAGVLAQAMQRRAELARQAAQTQAIGQLVGHPMTGITDPAVASTLAGHFITADSKAKPTPKVPPIYAARTEKGVIDAFTGKPIDNPDPNREYRFVGNDANADIRSANLSLARDTAQQRLINNFNGDPSVKKSQQSIDAARTIRDLVTSGNPISAAAIPTYMARMSGEVGNLSEADKKPFGGSRAIVTRFNQALTESSNGKITPENAQYVAQIANMIEKRSSKNIDILARRRAKQHAGSLFKEDDLYRAFNPEATDSSAAPKPTHRWNPALGKVEVIQ
jgi:hypothetical protein